LATTALTVPVVVIAAKAMDCGSGWHQCGKLLWINDIDLKHKYNIQQFDTITPPIKATSGHVGCSLFWEPEELLP
jgi:hypothetical protein